jgi:hypothetical protein
MKILWPLVPQLRYACSYARMGRNLFGFFCLHCGIRETKNSADCYENKFVDMDVYLPIYGTNVP